MKEQIIQANIETLKSIEKKVLEEKRNPLYGKLLYGDPNRKRPTLFNCRCSIKVEE